MPWTLWTKWTEWTRWTVVAAWGEIHGGHKTCPYKQNSHAFSIFFTNLRSGCSKPTKPPAMRTIKIFLASSNELEADRQAFKLEIGSKNNSLKDMGVFLYLDIWEDLSTMMSQTRSQDEYNKQIGAADLFVLLAWNKVGKYTEEEFDVAYRLFKSSGKPSIFTWVKEPPQAAEPTLQTFKDKLSGLGHFPAFYKDAADLLLQFNKELDRLDLSSMGKIDDTAGIYVDNRGANIKNQFNSGTFNNPTFQ
jgi:hypothetical protein